MRKMFLFVGLFLLTISMFFRNYEHEAKKRNKPSFKTYLQKRRPFYKKKSLPKIILPNFQAKKPIHSPRADISPRSSWITTFVTKLKRFHNEETRVSVKEERDIFQREGMALKQVLVRYQLPHKESSFRALINPNNGVILRTWDRTIYEKSSKWNILDPPVDFLEN